ncbi:serine/threonine dehydratase [uncultured Friedmanniella sp.]|uniref:serine/threonine dehydratase n=1 Tax=uncultured Friedmanniella sp. TaxID=335381 RepID=UPI0035CBE097
MTTTASTPAGIPTADDVRAAASRLRPYVRHTPLLRITIDGRALVLKLEQLQLSGSFKLRGALNAVLDGHAKEHIVTASGGNHGLGVATGASLLGITATVFVPESVPEIKARRIAATGVRLVRHGRTYAEAAAAAAELAAKPGHRYIPAYDDPLVVAGNGTVAAEVIDDVPEVDTVVVAAGGGGLAAGSALAVGARLLVAAEPERCRAVHDALEAGRPVDAPVESVASSALGATRVGDVPFAVLSARPSSQLASVLVSEAEILDARERLWEECRLAVEPAAAVPLAAWLAGLVPGELPCLVICGANAEWTPR